MIALQRVAYWIGIFFLAIVFCLNAVLLEQFFDCHELDLFPNAVYHIQVNEFCSVPSAGFPCQASIAHKIYANVLRSQKHSYKRLGYVLHRPTVCKVL